MRQEFPTKVRKAAVARANGKCERCEAVLKKGEAHFDHILPCALGGEPTLANCQLICTVCHSGKTRDDVGRIRKADRQKAIHTGVKQPTGTLRSAGFQKAEKQAKPTRPTAAGKTELQRRYGL